VAKKASIKKVTIQETSIDNTRGSVLWAYNHYRKSMMTSLLNDLIDLENNGLAEEYCQYIQKSLEYFVNATTEVPRGGFLTGPLYKQAQEFADLYFQWNKIEGSDPGKTSQRRKLLVQLRDQRQKITDRARSLQYELQNDLDKKVLADTYKAVGNLINIVPDLFKSLASAYGDYIKRGGFITA